jgi:hypothetical protein
MGIPSGDLDGSLEGTVQVFQQGMQTGIACLSLGELSFDPFKDQGFFIGEGHGFSGIWQGIRGGKPEGRP